MHQTLYHHLYTKVLRGQICARAPNDAHLRVPRATSRISVGAVAMRPTARAGKHRWMKGADKASLWRGASSLRLDRKWNRRGLWLNLWGPKRPAEEIW